METKQCAEGVLVKLYLDDCIPSQIHLLLTAQGMKQDKVRSGFTLITHKKCSRVCTILSLKQQSEPDPTITPVALGRTSSNHPTLCHDSSKPNFHGTGSRLYGHGELAGSSDSVRVGCAEPGGGTMIFTLLVPEDLPMHGGSADQGVSARVSPATVRN